MIARLAFLVDELGRSGGMKVIVGYAQAMAAGDDFAPELVVTGPTRHDVPAEHEGIPVRPLEATLDDELDVAVATWWETSAALYELRARRRVVFLQSVESRFYEERDHPLRFGAESVLGLPVGFVTVAGWIRDLVAELCPGARCTVVRNGIDKAAFPARTAPPGDGPLRVLVEGQPELWFKGVADAVATVREMSEPAEVTVVAAEPEAARALGADRVEGGLDLAGMARLYAEHDVLLKLSRVESLGLPPLEAMHVGLPAVVTPFTGHDEYLEHGRNGLVVGYDDGPGTVRALDLLARDRDLLARMSAAAVESTESWPSREQAAAELGAAMLRALEEPEPPLAPALAYRARAERRWIELSRQYARQAAVALDTATGDLANVKEALAERDRAIEELKQARAYRLAVGMRRVYQGVRGRG